MKNNISHYYMNKSDLKKLSKSQLIKMLLKQEKKPKIIVVDDTKAITRPRKSVKQMVYDYENNIIHPPIEFRDKPVPLPRTKKPVALPRTKIEQTDKALKVYTKSYEISIKNNKDPLVQLNNTQKAVAHHIISVLTSMKGLKFIETLKVTFTKMSDGEIMHKTAYFNGPTQTITNDTEITESLKTSKQSILNKIAVWISEGSGWTVQSVDSHHINIVKYKPMKGSSCIKLPTELRNSARGLINPKNEDNQCFRWCHIRHFNPQAKYPQRIKKVDKQYVENLDYSGIEFPVATKQYNKIEKQNEININVFGYEDKQPYPIYVSKEKYEDHMNLLLLITENKNNHYVLIKDFNKFMYNQTKHRERKHFCMHCLQCFSSEKVLINHKENCIQVNGTQAIKMPTKDNNILKFNNFHKQLAVPFVIYADFEAITEKIHGCQPMTNHLLKLIRSIQTVVMDTRSFVVMMINTQNQYKFTEVKKLFTNSWKPCWRKSNIVRRL